MRCSFCKQFLMTSCMKTMGVQVLYATSKWTIQICCRIRFHRPYIHCINSPDVKLTLQQSKFDAEGFASTSRACSSTLLAMLYHHALKPRAHTRAHSQLLGQLLLGLCPIVLLLLCQGRLSASHAVWDSSIVMSKYFEQWGSRWAGKKCLDLSAGCGLVGG